jgi:hypothetical protein
MLLLRCRAAVGLPPGAARRVRAPRSQLRSAREAFEAVGMSRPVEPTRTEKGALLERSSTGRTRPTNPLFPKRRSPERSSSPRRRSRRISSDVIYALHAHACIERGRVWQAEHYVGAVRDHALTLACFDKGCPQCRRVATTTFPQRPSLHSRLPTLPPSSLRRSGQPSPPPYTRS